MPNLIITKKCKKNKSIKLLPVSPVELVNGLRPANFCHSVRSEADTRNLWFNGIISLYRGCEISAFPRLSHGFLISFTFRNDKGRGIIKRKNGLRPQVETVDALLRRGISKILNYLCFVI